MKKLLWMNYVWVVIVIAVFMYSNIKQGYLIPPDSQSVAFEVGRLAGQLLPTLPAILAIAVMSGYRSHLRVTALVFNYIILVPFSIVILIPLASGEYLISVVGILFVLPPLINIITLTKMKNN